MSNTGLQIANLMMDNNKNAADMTHAVKVLGNGSMQRGFFRIGEFFSKEIDLANAAGLRRGRIQGGLVGALGAFCVGGLIWWLAQDGEDKTAHEAEGQKILRTMETAKAPSDTDTDTNLHGELSPDSSPEISEDTPVS